MTRFFAYAIGGLNIGFLAFGMCYFAWQVRYHWWGGSWTFGATCGFILFAITGFLLSVGAALAGVRLMRRQYSAVGVLLRIYIAELAYLVVVGVTWYAVPDSTAGRSIVIGLWGIAEGFLAPQLGLFYPLIGLACMLGLYTTRHSAGARLYWRQTGRDL